MTRRRVGPGDRGRVPFALVGVVLVVTSALFAAAVPRPARPPEPAVDVAMERTTADARTALRRAVARAGVAAASNPITTPTDTPYGQVLSEEHAFRDALRVRVYLLARERFASIGRTHRGVRAGVSLAATPTPDALARARDRVTVERAGPDGAQLDVTVRNVTQTARHGGRVVGRRTLALSVRVRSPVLAVHDRVVEFQERLEAPVTEPGLSQTVTARLYAVAWARGYAQYGGAPVENVVSNRHVGLVTNGALLTLQRSVFGESDPDGREAHARATMAMALTEAMGTVDAGRFVDANALLRERIRAASGPRERAGVRQPPVDSSATPGPDDTMTVGVDGTALEAFEFYAVGDGINETIQAVYTARVRQVANARTVSGGSPGPPGDPDRPGEWELVGSHTHTTVENVESAPDGPGVSIPDDYHVLTEHDRVVTLSHERSRVWRRRGTTRRAGDVSVTIATATERQRVTVAVLGRHETADFAPDRPIRTVHEPGGPFDGPNLADISDRVNETLPGARSPGRVAARAARGTAVERTLLVEGEWPGELPGWAYPELVELRREVRNVSVAVRRGRVGTFEANPSARLTDRLRERRADLLDAPAVYDSTADRARVALRGRYLDRVIATLERRANYHSGLESRLDGAVRHHTAGSLDMLRRGLRARRVDADRDDTGDLSLVVDGAPPYLTLAGVEHTQVSAVEARTTVHPLVARNVNVASVPYGDVTDTVSNALGSSSDGAVTLRTAGLALQSARALDGGSDSDPVTDREYLRRQVTASLRGVRVEFHAVLRAHGVGDSRRDRREIVADAFDRWDTPAGAALAVSNRSVVGALVDSARRHESVDLSSRQRDSLGVALYTRLQTTLESGGASVEGAAVSAVTDQVTAAVGSLTESAAADMAARANRSLARLPAGIPLAPPVTPWYATANAWVVTVGGRYERFAVEAPRRTPAGADASLSYVRDGSNVTLDVDGDGTGERLGRNDRIDFRFETGVVVVVPSGRSGVGDVDGNPNETSPGWRFAGPESAEPSGAGASENASATVPGAIENTMVPRTDERG